MPSVTNNDTLTDASHFLKKLLLHNINAKYTIFQVRYIFKRLYLKLKHIFKNRYRDIMFRNLQNLFLVSPLALWVCSR